MRRLLTGIMLIFVASLLALPVEGQAARKPFAQQVKCSSPPPSRSDIIAALSVAGDTFDPLDWTVEITNEIYPSLTTVAWLSDKQGAVAYLQLFHYNCGVTDAIRQRSAKPDFELAFENYRSYEETARCAARGILLFEFDAVSLGGVDERTYFWVKQLSPTRIVTFHLVIPAAQPALLDDLAHQLYPELPSCDSRRQIKGR